MPVHPCDIELASRQLNISVTFVYYIIYLLMHYWFFIVYIRAQTECDVCGPLFNNDVQRIYGRGDLFRNHTYLAIVL